MIHCVATLDTTTVFQTLSGSIFTLGQCGNAALEKVNRGHACFSFENALISGSISLATGKNTLKTPAAKSVTMPLGVVIRRMPGVTRWAKHVWKAVAVLPGAPNAHWKEMRQDGDAVEYHAATLNLTLYRTDTEAYLQGLSSQSPAIYVVMRESRTENPLDVTLVTASPYEAQDYADTGEELVEKVPMPEGLVAWIRDFVTLHHEDEMFVKRRRNKARVDQVQDGIGDARIRQTADVYRAPGARKGVVH